MHWLIYIVITASIWSIAGLIDRYAMLGRIKEAKLYLMLPIIGHFLMAFLLIPFFEINFLTGTLLLYCLFAGILEAFTWYYWFIGVRDEEVSKVGPLWALFSSILVLIFGNLFLGEVLLGNEALAFVLFLIGGVLLGLKYQKKKLNLTKGVKPIFIGALLASVHIVFFKYVLNEVGFWTGFFYSRLGTMIVGIFVMILWGRIILKEWCSLSLKLKNLIVGNQIFAFFANIPYFYAFTLATTGLVKSAMGIQYAMVFLFATAVSHWKIELLAEDMEKKELWKKVAGIAVIILAIYVLNT